MYMTKTRETKGSGGLGAAGKRRTARPGAGAGLGHSKAHHLAGVSLRYLAARSALRGHGPAAPCACAGEVAYRSAGPEELRVQMRRAYSPSGSGVAQAAGPPALRAGGSRHPADTGTGVFMAPRFGHDISQVLVSPNIMEPTQTSLSRRLLTSPETPAGEEEADQYSSDGLLASLAGSGTCVNGGGESVCSPTTGKYGITSNSNTCCTKECTQAHEQQHVTDHDGWGCCAALSAAWGKKGADKAELVKKYNTWFATANLLSECNAYTRSVECADALATTKDCAGTGKDTDCCKDIADYKLNAETRAKSNCGAAPKTVPPCPSF
jgi:hypothetical protein